MEQTKHHARVTYAPPYLVAVPVLIAVTTPSKWPTSREPSCVSKTAAWKLWQEDAVLVEHYNVQVPCGPPGTRPASKILCGTTLGQKDMPHARC